MNNYTIEGDTLIFETSKKEITIDDFHDILFGFGSDRRIYTLKDEIEHIKTIVLHENITNIGAGAFGEFENLENVILPDTITEIGERAFECCSNLKSVNLPSSLKKIGRNPFSSCKQLQYIFADRISFDKSSFDNLAPLTLFFHTQDNISFHVEISKYPQSNTHIYKFLKEPSFETYQKIESLQTQIDIAVAYGMSEHKDKKMFQEQVKKMDIYALVNIVMKNDTLALDFYMNNKSFSMKSIDVFLEKYNREIRPEIRIMVLEYKEQNKGYDKNKIIDRFDI